ncbi:hypothetical protein HMPREF1051_0869 [Neisseria sicca VK64]|uniref:Uncharacterized protein n=1 Tax=Neisseria sicca VK64 TaxID=1095748 RepID=I2NVX5_NEISI|nr:hypothetical protein HMPREF1051_0869 [Neisseria sicca VK64]
MPCPDLKLIHYKMKRLCRKFIDTKRSSEIRFSFSDDLLSK